MKKILIVAAVILVIILVIAYIRPPFVDKLHRKLFGTCLDGGVEYYFDKNLGADIPRGPIGMGQLRQIAIAEKYTCGPFTTYYVIEKGLNREVSRWTFHRTIARHNKACNECITSRAEGLT